MVLWALTLGGDRRIVFVKRGHWVPGGPRECHVHRTALAPSGHPSSLSPSPSLQFSFISGRRDTGPLEWVSLAVLALRGRGFLTFLVHYPCQGRGRALNFVGHLHPSHLDQLNPHQVVAILARGLLDKEFPLPRGPLHQPILIPSLHASLRLSSTAIPSGMTQIPASPSPSGNPSYPVLCPCLRLQVPRPNILCSLWHSTLPRADIPWAERTEWLPTETYALQEWG